MAHEQTVFVLADKALQRVVEQIRPEQWELPIPETMTYGRGDMTLRDLINYHVYDDIWVPDTLTGKTIAEVGNKYDGDLLGADPILSFASAVDAATSAVQALAADQLDTIVHLTYGDFPIRDYLKHITIFRGFRSYTIAELLSIDSTMPSELVKGLWDEVVPEVEQWRAMGVFGPAISVPEDADMQTKLLGVTGFLIV